MQQLGTIGQALYMRTFFHFGNHYTGVNRNRLSFQKRYDDVCAEWLGGLKVLKYKADIVRDQLGPHLNQLIAAGFLSSYDITKARGQNGLVITFTPGAAFFADYDRFYRRRAQGELQWEFRADERQVGDPLKFAYLFIEKRDGRKPAASTFVTSKEKENARQMLTEISIDEAPAFLDFALAAARQTNFDVQTLGGLRAYLPRYKARQAAQGAAEHAETARRTSEDERIAYDGYRRHATAATTEQSSAAKAVRPAAFANGAINSRS